MYMALCRSHGTLICVSNCVAHGAAKSDLDSVRPGSSGLPYVAQVLSLLWTIPLVADAGFPLMTETVPPHVSVVMRVFNQECWTFGSVIRFDQTVSLIALI